jgi:DNA-binding response OmpR family regulator
MILVVDNNENLIESIRGELERVGYSVESAADGVEAFNHLRDPRCKLMLLSMKLPKINGAELLILMGAEDIEVPVIVMGELQDLSAEEMAEFPDVVDFIKKPFSMGHLVEKVRLHAKRETVR